MNIALIIGGSIAALSAILALTWYRLVPPSEAHIVVRPSSKFVVCTDKNVTASTGSNSYFQIPFITNVRILDITIKELKHSQLTWEKNLARFLANWSLKFHIHDPLVASSKYVDDEELSQQLVSVVEAGVNAVCSKYDIADLRSKKKDMEKDIKDMLEENLNSWGVSLVNFQLVDFQDTKDSRVITDLSLRRETEISSNTRQVNAEQIKQAEMKESEARELSKTRSIQADEVIAMREQDKKQKIAVQEKLATDKEYEVIKTRTLAQANIDREQQEIFKQKLKLEGEGYRLQQEEKAKGDAATIREKGLAEADAKERLQSALNKFTPNAINALTAEIRVNANRDIGIETAKSLQNADIKVFSGGEAGKKGFDLGELFSSVGTTNPEGKYALLDRVSTPNAILHNNRDDTPKDSESSDSVIMPGYKKAKK